MAASGASAQSKCVGHAPVGCLRLRVLFVIQILVKGRTLNQGDEFHHGGIEEGKGGPGAKYPHCSATIVKTPDGMLGRLPGATVG